jgi:hypothetical protein
MEAWATKVQASLLLALDTFKARTLSMERIAA